MDRTSDFGSDSEGSNPSATTIKIYRTLFSVSYFFKFVFNYYYLTIFVKVVLTFILIAQIHAILRENKKLFHYFLCIKYVTYWKSVIKKINYGRKRNKRIQKKT